MMAALMLGSVGCSSDEEALSEKEDDNVIATFYENQVEQNISEFFHSELDNYIVSQFPWNECFIKDSCILINSKEEFHSFYKGNISIPEIDFTKQTLIIGWKVCGSLRHIEKLNIKKEQSGYSLNVYTYRQKDEAYLIDEIQLCYWGLFPKLNENPVSINVIFNLK